MVVGKRKARVTAGERRAPGQANEGARTCEEQELLAAILEHHPDGIMVIDRAGRFKVINPGLQRLVGRPVGTPSSMEELAEILVPDPEHRAEAFRTWAEDLASEHPPAHVLAFRHGSGELRWGRFQQAHLPNGDILIGGVDFTAQKRLEQEALEAQELYRALVLASPDAVTVTDLEGRITHVSERTLASYGFDRAEEMIGRSAFDLLAPESRAPAAESLEDVRRSGIARLEAEAVRRDGSRFFAELTASLVRGSGGAPVAFIGVTRDVTERRRSEEALRESEERYRTLFEHAPVGLGLADHRGKILACNAAILAMSGYSREDLLGLDTVAELLPDRDERRRLLALTGEQREVRQVETTLRRKDGSPYHALLSLAEVRLQRRPCWQAVIEDVDERTRIMRELEVRNEELARANTELARANEELARLHREQDEFIASMSHELRTPLVTGIGYVDLLLEGHFGRLSPRADDRMRVALRNLKRLSRLIDDLLNYNRLAGRTPLAPEQEPVSLSGVFHDCATELLTRTKRTGLDLRVELIEGLPPVLVDPELLRAVIANLLDNADRHGGTLSQIRVAARAEGERVKISVSDDGVGMEPEVRERAFEPFYKAKGSFKGLGLGLFIVRRILEAHGSEAVLTSAPGQGTTFTFSLAVAER